VNSPRSQLPPRHPHLSPLVLARRRQPRRRGTGRGGRRRVRPQGSKPTPGIGGGASPESFPPIAIKPCFLYARRRRHRHLHCTQVSSTIADEHDAPAPLDVHPSVAYRFGKIKWPNERTPPVRFGFIHFLPGAKRYGPARSGFIWNRPSSVRIWSDSFLINSRLFRIISNMFQICFSNLNSKRFRNPFLANEYVLESLGIALHCRTC
jgi:hypothetical protein